VSRRCVSVVDASIATFVEVGGPLETHRRELGLGQRRQSEEHVADLEARAPASYAATKAAVIESTRVIALPYPRSGIRANSILPGMMNTPMVHAPGVITAYGGSAEEMVRRRDAQCPLGRMGDAWDVAYAALSPASITRPNTLLGPNWSSMAV
jgi:NAD(P)-dependent dehydrogenase (short-subunit alcohol dehydrogenase family)